MLPHGLLKGGCRMAAHSMCHPSPPPWLASQICEAPSLGQAAPRTISAQEKGWRKKQQQVCLQMPPLESDQGPGSCQGHREPWWLWMRTARGRSAELCMTISALCICNDSTGREHNAKILDLCVMLLWGQMSSLVLHTVNATSVPNPNDSPHPAPSPLPSAANGTDGWKKRIAIFKKQQKKKSPTLLFLHFFCVKTLPSFQEKSIQNQSVNRFPAASSTQGEAAPALANVPPHQALLALQHRAARLPRDNDGGGQCEWKEMLLERALVVWQEHRGAQSAVGFPEDKEVDAPLGRDSLIAAQGAGVDGGLRDMCPTVAGVEHHLLLHMSS